MRNINFFLLLLSFPSFIYSAKNDLTTFKNPAVRYLGGYAKSSEYRFQEKLREYDLGIRNILNDKNKQIFINGWGQLIGALITLEEITVKKDFIKIIHENINSALNKGHKQDNPLIHVNIRSQSKNIMMYPHQNKYLPWRKVNIPGIAKCLNKLLPKHPAEFSIFEDKCYLNIGNNKEQTIIMDLWENGFNNILTKHGYCNLEANQEHPHITLLNSNHIASLQDAYINKYGPEGKKQFNEIISEWLDNANKELKKTKKTIVFTQLESTYSEDYSPFEEVIVVKLKAPIIKELLQKLAKTIEKEANFLLPIKQTDSFHLTVATKYRKAHDFSNQNLHGILNMLKKCKHQETLLNFYNMFEKDN